MGAGKGKQKRTETSTTDNTQELSWPGEEIFMRKISSRGSSDYFHIDTSKISYLTNEIYILKSVPEYYLGEKHKKYGVKELEFATTEYLKDILGNNTLSLELCTPKENEDILTPLNEVDINKLQIKLDPNLAVANFLPITLLYNNKEITKMKYILGKPNISTDYKPHANLRLIKYKYLTKILADLINKSFNPE